MADLIITEKANITAIADKVRSLDNSSASLNFEEMKDKLTFERQNVDGALAALAEKGVEVPKGSTSAALPELIGNIQIGSPVVEKKDISFYDYDGTLLYSYTVEEANALTALPAGPTHEGLVFDGWNWSLEDVRSLTRPMDIGAMFATDDGTTRIYLHLEEGHTNITFNICVNGTVTVNWGDGTAYDTLTGTDLTVKQWTPVHNYTFPGDYIIKLTVNGEAQLEESFSKIKSKQLRNSISKIEIGTNIIIGYDAFYFCSSLLNVTIPSSITSLGEYAFECCYSLLSVTIPSGVETLEEGTFYECLSILNITIPKSVTYLSSSVFELCASLQNITLPDSITRIGGEDFSKCSSLSNIIIPSGITWIRGNTFQNCVSLSNITIPDTVTKISEYAFQGCASLSSITIPAGVTIIKNYAFQNCDSLSNVTIPDNNHITSIGEYAFGGCISLLDIINTNQITAIQRSTFENCFSLSDITIPNGIQSIGQWAFLNCVSLSSVTFPNGLTTIETAAFSLCEEVTYYDFTQLSSIPTLSNQAFGALPAGCEIRVPASLETQWKAATNWTVYADHIVGV